MFSSRVQKQDFQVKFKSLYKIVGASWVWCFFYVAASQDYLLNPIFCLHAALETHSGKVVVAVSQKKTFLLIGFVFSCFSFR